MTKWIVLCGPVIAGGIALAQVGAVEPIASIPTEPGCPAGAGGGCQKSLRDVLVLNDMQLQRLEEVGFAREDELFPFAQDLLQKQWELRRQLRGSSPDDPVADMLFEELQEIFDSMEAVNQRYRSAALALLSAHQLRALARLEEALELQFPAWEAVQANLIDPGDGFPFGPALFRSVGFGALFPFSVPEMSSGGSQSAGLQGLGQARRDSPRSPWAR